MILISNLNFPGNIGTGVMLQLKKSSDITHPSLLQLIMRKILVLIVILCVLCSINGFINNKFKTKIIKHEKSKTLMTATLIVTSNVDPMVIAKQVDAFDVIPRRFRKSTKQLATIGPASSTVEMIEKLFLSGADIFRLNFSHGEHSEKAKIVDMIRAIEKKYNHPICILADLQGPKLRVGSFENDKVILVSGQKFKFDLKDELGSPDRVRLPHPEILNTLKSGDILLLDDGKLRMKVIDTTMKQLGNDGSVTCEVVIGGALSNRKGVNTPTIVIPMSPLTTKDRKDLEFALTLSIDWVALSFVQTPADITELRGLAGKKVKIMAKLEKPSAIDYLDEIVDLADGIMVARGDLGVEMNPWDVPLIQKRIVETCKIFGKPVVIATQMMESMIENPTPTRAEASDCATAIFDSSDAVMLSAESAAGKYPVESVTMQQLIINKVETDENYSNSLDKFAQDTMLKSKDATTAAITMAARTVSDIAKAKIILAFTASGGTVLRVAKIRPKVPIVAVCYNWEIARQLAIVWGVYPIVVAEPKDFNLRDELIKVCKVVKSKGFVDPEKDLITVTAGLPFGVPGTTNVCRVMSAAGPEYWFDEKGKLKKYEETPNSVY
jgi:pyruvate kinase